MTEREEFFKHMIEDYLFVDGTDSDGWRWFGARKFKQFGSSGDTTCTFRIKTGFCSHIDLEQKEYIIVETGEDPIGHCPERAYAYHSYEEMFDNWKTNFDEMFQERDRDIIALVNYGKDF